ncbi:MAG: Fur family transcriptional regulator [Nanoarchaeota archaeon]
MAIQRNTPQRELIKKVVKESNKHPSAEEVYKAVKKTLPSISPATVYRNLNNMASEGDVKKIYVENESHFDGDTKKHHHFVCQKCEKIFDNHSPNICEKAIKDWEKDGFLVKNSEIICYGFCKQCRGENGNT